MPAPFLRLVFVAALSAISAGALAEERASVPAPAFKPGDVWLYDQVFEKGQNGFNEKRMTLAVEEIDGDTMTVGIKREGAPTASEAHVVGTDWSHRRLVDGQQTVTTRPFQFPMIVGQSWKVNFLDSTRRGNVLSVHVRESYTVVGWEDIDVPAGHFHALKVEAKGVLEGMYQFPSVAGSAVIGSPGNTTGISHAQGGGVRPVVTATHAEFYYVPGVKNFVKSIEDEYNTDNVRLSRETQSLISFTPAT